MDVDGNTDYNYSSYRCRFFVQMRDEDEFPRNMLPSRRIYDRSSCAFLRRKDDIFRVASRKLCDGLCAYDVPQNNIRATAGDNLYLI